MGKLIVITGTDGTGKETQSKLLFEELKSRNLKVRLMSFPNYSERSSELVKMYLSGEIDKDLNKVDPYLAGTLYSIDRAITFQRSFEEFFRDEKSILISDRWVESNLIHHISKIKTAEEKEKYIEFMEDLEYNRYHLPKPDIVIFLNIDKETSNSLRKQRVSKLDKDIHEANDAYMTECNEIARGLAEEFNWEKIECVEQNVLKTREKINAKIIKKVEEKLCL